jgi:hypothetical protein
MVRTPPFHGGNRGSNPRGVNVSFVSANTNEVSGEKSVFFYRRGVSQFCLFSHVVVLRRHGPKPAAGVVRGHLGAKYSESRFVAQMSNFTIFIVGTVVTLITGMGVLISMVFVGYKK